MSHTIGGTIDQHAQRCCGDDAHNELTVDPYRSNMDRNSAGRESFINTSNHHEGVEAHRERSQLIRDREANKYLFALGNNMDKTRESRDTDHLTSKLTKSAVGHFDNVLQTKRAADTDLSHNGAANYIYSGTSSDQLYKNFDTIIYINILQSTW